MKTKYTDYLHCISTMLEGRREESLASIEALLAVGMEIPKACSIWREPLPGSASRTRQQGCCAARWKVAAQSMFASANEARVLGLA